MSDFLTVERLGPMQALTPEGYLVVSGVPLARTGPQTYSDQELPLRGDSSGRIIVDRLPADVFHPATIASLNGKAITLDHPDDDVCPANHKSLAVGTVINPRRGQYAQSNLLIGDLVIHDPEAIEAIRDRDVREVSVGYKASYRQAGAGRGRQTDIICNHVALVRDGRCGPLCRIGDKAFFARHDMDNLGVGGTQLRPFRLPRGAGAPSRDEGAQGSTGSQGSPAGGAPRRAEREPTRPALRAGAFTTDEEERRPAGGLWAPSPERDGVRYRARVAEANDEEPEDITGLGEKVGEVEAPPEGHILRLVPDGDMVAILCVPDEGDADLNTNDRTYRHKISDGRDPILARMNRINRQRTKDWAETKQVTLYRYKGLLSGERIALEGPNEYGRYDLILYSRTSPSLAGDVPPGTGNRQKPNSGSHWPTQAWIPTPGRAEKDIHELDARISTGDRAMTESQRLRSINRAAAAFWRRSA